MFCGKTFKARLPNQELLIVRAGLWHPGPGCRQAPSVSVTCEVVDRHHRFVSGGADHALIVEHFPSLKPLIDCHLWGVGEGPMHYIANAVYWWELALGYSRW